MKVITPQMSWHNREPLFSADFHPHLNKIATAGSDNDVKIWRYEITSNPKEELNGSNLNFTFVASLNRHLKAVNAVRFAPNGEYLASGGDDGLIFIWKEGVSDGPNVSSTFSSNNDEDDIVNLESWSVACILRGHVTDVYDLCWSSDSLHLVSGSTDNSAIIWDIAKGTMIQQLKDHSHYVQGVAWDPKGQYLATQSSDRTCRIYSLNTTTTSVPSSDGASTPKKKQRREFAQCMYVLSKREVEQPKKQQPSLPTAPSDTSSNVTSQPQSLLVSNEKQKQRMFEDETINSFFRRLCWSPDGSVLFLTAGIYYPPAGSSTIPTPSVSKSHISLADPDSHSSSAADIPATFYTSYACPRNALNRPAFHLPVGSKAVICVRCNRILFKRRLSSSATVTSTPNVNNNNNDNSNTTGSSGKNKSLLLDLPYRFVYALATLDSVLIYDSESLYPIAVLSNIHYAEITDLTWSREGYTLLIASKDGFCTIVSFQQEELGEIYQQAPQSCTTASSANDIKCNSLGSNGIEISV